jgi:hypothetical protein
MCILSWGAEAPRSTHRAGAEAPCVYSLGGLRPLELFTVQGLRPREVLTEWEAGWVGKGAVLTHKTPHCPLRQQFESAHVTFVRWRWRRHGPVEGERLWVRLPFVDVCGPLGLRTAWPRGKDLPLGATRWLVRVARLPNSIEDGAVLPGRVPARVNSCRLRP